MSRYEKMSPQGRINMLRYLLDGKTDNVHTDHDSIEQMAEEFARLLTNCSTFNVEVKVTNKLTEMPTFNNKPVASSRFKPVNTDVKTEQTIEKVEQLSVQEKTHNVEVCSCRVKDDAIVEQIKSLYISGVSQAAIARQLNISRTTVVKYTKTLNK